MPLYSEALTRQLMGVKSDSRTCENNALVGKGGIMSRIHSLQLGACAAAVILGLGASSHAYANAIYGPVQLQQGTATFSQGVLGGGPYSPEMAIDGIFYTDTPCCSNGWTINHFPNNDPSQEFTTDEIAVWETVSDVGPSTLTFKMYFLDPNPGHLLGRFRLSVTTDDRSTFADGLRVGGDVDANWTILSNPLVNGPEGMTFTTLSDYSVLAGGTVPGHGIYEVSDVVDLYGITGVRLEVFKDPSLPADGPGFAANGNFVLTELELMTAPVPEPEIYAMMAVGLGVMGWVARKKKRKQAIT
jgi:hypothetical protein